MKTPSIILLVPSFLALLMCMYGMSKGDYGLAYASMCVTLFGLTMSILINKIKK